MTKQQIPKEKSIAAFALTRRATKSEIDRWFDERPDVAAEIEQNVSLYTDHTIWQWLQKWHEFPYSVSYLRRFREEAESRTAR